MLGQEKSSLGRRNTRNRQKWVEAGMAVEHKISEAAQANVDTVAETHRFIGQSWMGWVALYAILLLLDQIAS